ncbi:MAG: YHS domain-containing protein, partial [Sinobacteraceae bacterium]|nr:YHS domain-containing protein [Nevskiaceae bacterium]
QRLMDKWFWRGLRLLSLVAAMMDYMLPKRVMSWAEAWQIYGEDNGQALFHDLARYGIKEPKGWQDAGKARDHISHQFMLALYHWSFGTSFHGWVPSDSEMDWLSKKYPDTFDKYYRPRWNHFRKLEEAGTPFQNYGLPKLCQTCQLPCLFTEPDDPLTLSNREVDYNGEHYHFCSDHCKDIFEYEPEKFVHAWLPINQIFQGTSGGGGLDNWMKWTALVPGQDNGLFEGSQDQKNFEAWNRQATSNADA